MHNPPTHVSQNKLSLKMLISHFVKNGQFPSLEHRGWRAQGGTWNKARERTDFLD